jgi:hypothetical protein
MIEYLVPAFNAVNMNLSRPYPRNLLDHANLSGAKLN